MVLIIIGTFSEDILVHTHDMYSKPNNIKRHIKVLAGSTNYNLPY